MSAIEITRIEIRRQDLSISQLRAEAARTADAKQARRLLSASKDGHCHGAGWAFAAGSLRNQLQARVQCGNNEAKIVAAFQNEAGRRDHRIGALLSRQPRSLLDPVERIFARAPVNRKNRFLGGKIDPVVAPFAAGDLAAERRSPPCACKRGSPRDYLRPAPCRS